MGNTLFSENRPVGLGGDFAASYQGSDWGTESSKSQFFLNAGTVAVKPKVLRVAAYCRVSSLHSEQEDSLENQSAHYTKYIRSNPHWRMAGIYTDFGKSGTLTFGRSGFNRLIRHALQGKVDLILCKSVSRFARNVLDTLDKVRMLKEHGVRVIFDKENIDTDSMQSEFILTMMAAVAQEESRSISENILWANSKRYERGEPCFRRVLGYVQDDDKYWVVQQKEAIIVKEAFDLCLQGNTPAQIARVFIRKGYETVKGRKEWSGTAVRDILKNNIYVGEVLCQKTYSRDHMSHASQINRGEKNQYLIQDHHESIIDREIYNRAQEMLMRRTKPSKKGSKKKYPLSSRLVCGNCGGNLQRFICRGVVTWRCGKRIKSKELCNMGGIREKNVRMAMQAAMKNRYYQEDEQAAVIYNPVWKMEKDLKNVEIRGDIEYNQLKIELERILFEENIAILNGTDVNIDELKAKRIKVETKLREREYWWNLLEADEPYRFKALKKLEPGIKANVPLDVMLNELKKIEYLRAWVVRVKALSPILFSLTWVTGEEIEVELVDRGDIEDV